MPFVKGQSGNPKGRKKGTPNKATQQRQAAVEASGITPLEYMLAVMRNPDEDPTERLRAAISAAEFVHPKLARIEQGRTDEEKDFIRELMGIVKEDAPVRALTLNADSPSTRSH